MILSQLRAPSSFRSLSGGGQGTDGGVALDTVSRHRRDATLPGRAPTVDSERGMERAMANFWENSIDGELSCELDSVFVSFG